MKFWIELQTMITENPNHPLGRLIEYGKTLNLPFLKHYEKLETDFVTPQNCQDTLTRKFRDESSEKIRRKSNDDPESRLGMYMQVNPHLTPITPVENILECERVVLTRYRSGSHNLKIESGRLHNPTIPRDERLCRCNNGIQSLSHVLFDCPLLAELYREYNYTTIEEALKLPTITKFFLKMEKIVKLDGYK